MEEKETALGIEENIEGLLCYLLGWISGIVFLLIEKKNSFVRFHAMQSLVVFGGLFIAGFVLGVIPIIGIISILIWPVSVILWLFLMFKAYKGEQYKLPWVGDFAEEKAAVSQSGDDV